jgi:hypothetical protein
VLDNNAGGPFFLNNPNNNEIIETSASIAEISATKTAAVVDVAKVAGIRKNKKRPTKWEWKSIDLTHMRVPLEPNHLAQKNVSRPVIRRYARRKPWPIDERVDLDPNLVERLRRAVRESVKEPVLDVLLRAGTEMDESIVQDLPTWESVTNMYGSEPVILGLETCQAFRSNVDMVNRWIAPGGM